MISAQVHDPARQELESELKTTTDARWYRRVKIIALSAQGQTVPQLATICAVCQATIRAYMKRYHAGGLPQLQRRTSDGPSPTVPQDTACWEDLLHRSPSQFDQRHTAVRNWMQARLVKYGHHYLAVPMPQAGLRMLFKRLGIRWNRSKLKIGSPDPLYTVKRERVETLKKSPRRAVVPSRGHGGRHEAFAEARLAGISRFHRLTLVP